MFFSFIIIIAQTANQNRGYLLYSLNIEITFGTKYWRKQLYKKSGASRLLFHCNWSYNWHHNWKSTVLSCLDINLISLFVHHLGWTVIELLWFGWLFHLWRTTNFNYCTMVDRSQEYRLKYWATRLSVCSFARTAHSFARSLTLLTPSLMGQWMIGWIFYLFFSIIDHSVLPFSTP